MGYLLGYQNQQLENTFNIKHVPSCIPEESEPSARLTSLARKSSILFLPGTTKMQTITPHNWCTQITNLYKELLL
jgi:hypothetical protein